MPNLDCIAKDIVKAYAYVSGPFGQLIPAAFPKSLFCHLVLLVFIAGIPFTMFADEIMNSHLELAPVHSPGICTFPR